MAIRHRRGLPSHTGNGRKAPRRDFGVPPGKRPRGFWRRILDPVFYLKAIMALSALALIVVPLAADGVNAALRPATLEGRSCRILSVIDGDTVSLWCDDSGISRARLTGFDAPELFSPRCTGEYLAAQKASWALRAMIFSADRIDMRATGMDRYGRRLLAVTLDGVDLAVRMTKAGHARAYDGGKRRPWCD